MVRLWLCGRELDLQSRGCRFDFRPGILCKKVYTQPSIPLRSVNEYQLQLGSQRLVWLILLADETQRVQVKLWYPLTLRAVNKWINEWMNEDLFQATMTHKNTYSTHSLPECLEIFIYKRYTNRHYRYLSLNTHGRRNALWWRINYAHTATQLLRYYKFTAGSTWKNF